MRINIFKKGGEEGWGESCGIRRFAGALTGRGFRVYYNICISARVCHPGFQKYICGNDGRISEAFFARAFSPRFGEKFPGNE